MKKPKACHTGMQRGAKVLAILRNGEQVIGKYIDNKDRFVRLDTRKILTKDLRSLTYYRTPPEPGKKA